MFNYQVINSTWLLSVSISWEMIDFILIVNTSRIKISPTCDQWDLPSQDKSAFYEDERTWKMPRSFSGNPYRITVGAMHKRQNAEIITRRDYYCNPSGALYAKFIIIIRVFCVSRHYNNSPQPPWVFLRVRCIRLLLRSPFSLSRNWRDRVRGPMISGFIFRIRCGFLREVCAPCAVTKHRNSYERGRSISERKQVALQFRSPVLFMVEW